MAFFGGIGGGVSRDVLLNDIPSPLKDPTYLVVCVLMGLLGLAIYRYADSKEEQFRTRTLAFFKSFTLPWFAILGAHKALDHDLGIFAAIVVGAPRDHRGRSAHRPLLRRHAGDREAVGAPRHDGGAGELDLHA